LLNFFSHQELAAAFPCFLSKRALLFEQPSLSDKSRSSVVESSFRRQRRSGEELLGVKKEQDEEKEEKEKGMGCKRKWDIVAKEEAVACDEGDVRQSVSECCPFH
jgi:hypothetical protein